MAGGPSGKKKKTTKSSSAADESTSNPETLERKRLKTLAFSNKILSQTPAKPHTPLAPSKIVAKHHGRDIVKKSQRKNRFLFSFPGLLAPISGGKVGELKDLGSKNPILYMDFPQGRMKLFGTIVYPKNRYLTLQFPRGGKNVMCEDYFDNMIVFSDAWWIGREDENPEENRLDFPEELKDGKQADYDFKGGAGGGASANKQVGLKNEVTNVQDRSPSPMLEDDFSDDENKDSVIVTPVRQSARTAGKKFKFAEASPEDDSIASDADESEEDKKTTEKKENASVVFDIDDEDPTPNPGAPSGTESKKQSSSSVKMNKTREDSSSNRGSLVQTTISTLFKKVEEKKTSTNLKKASTAKVSAKKEQQTGSKRKSIQDGGSAKKAKVNEKNTVGKGKGKKKANESDEDDIEEFSSDSLDNDGSDEDWEA